MMSRERRLERKIDAALKLITVRVLSNFLDSVFGPLYRFPEAFADAKSFAIGGLISPAQFRMADGEHVICHAFINDTEIKEIGA